MKKQTDAVAMTIRFPKRLKANLEKQAREERRSLNQHIVVVLEKAMEEGGVTTMPRREAVAMV